jgi:hypothetical protein
MNYDLNKIFEHFSIEGRFVVASPYGNGHINDTFAATVQQQDEQVRFLFQRINHDVFKNPERLMDNIRRVTQHQQLKLGEHPEAHRRSLKLVLCRDGELCHRDSHGNYWRCYDFIEKATTFDVVETPEQAYQAAKIFGQFQNDLVDLQGERLFETIPDFHNTPKRFSDLLLAIESDPCNRASKVRKEIEFALTRESITGTLLELSTDGEIPERITHNDTKLNNLMIDDETGEGICVIDLDTVMPGLPLYDFGDMVRTATSAALEDETDLSKVTMQIHLYEALIKGYLSSAGEFLTPAEKSHLAFSGKLLTFETGIRFLTDYLDGDVYFKSHRPGHNLDRCRNQFKLVTSIEEQEDAMSRFGHDW